MVYMEVVILKLLIQDHPTPTVSPTSMFNSQDITAVNYGLSYPRKYNHVIEACNSFPTYIYTVYILLDYQ